MAQLMRINKLHLIKQNTPMDQLPIHSNGVLCTIIRYTNAQNLSTKQRVKFGVCAVLDGMQVFVRHAHKHAAYANLVQMRAVQNVTAKQNMLFGFLFAVIRFCGTGDPINGSRNLPFE